MAETVLKPGQEVFLYSIDNAAQPVGRAVVAHASEREVRVRLTSGRLRAPSPELAQREIVVRWEADGMREECPMTVEEVDEETLRLTPRGRERREFLRIQVRLPLYYEAVAERFAEGEAARILAGASGDDDVTIEAERFWHSEDLGERMDEQFGQISRYLNQIDAKLDYLIGLAEGRESPRTTTFQVYMLDISGAGLSFLDTRPHDVGALLKTRVQMNRFPLEEIVTLSKVVRCLPAEDEQGRQEIGVQFTTIREADREKIFRFISRAERTMLRQRKEHLTP